MLKSFLTFSSITFISRILGYLRDILAARTLGAGIMNDLFIICFRLPNFFRTILGEGAINSSFIPIYTKLDTKEKEDFLTSVLLSLNVCFILLLVTLYCFLPQILNVIAPGVSGENLEVAVELCSITIFYILFIGNAVFFCTLLNIKNIYAPLALLPFAMNIALIAAFILYEYYSTDIYCLAYSIVTAGIVQFLCSICIAIYNFPRLFQGKFLISSAKLFFKRLIPVFFTSGFNQIYTFANQIIGSFIIGGISYLYYADRIIQLPTALIGVSMANIVVVKLSKQLNDHQLTNNALIVVFNIAIPAFLGCLYLSKDIVNGLFNYGKFGEEQFLNTAMLLQMISFTIIPNCVNKIMQAVFFANDDTKTPLYIAALSLIIHVTTLIIFFQYIGIFAVGFGMAFATIFSMMALLTIACYKEIYHFQISLIKQIFIATAFSSIMILAVYSVGQFLHFHRLINLIILCFLGALVYALLQLKFNKDIFTWEKLS